MQIEQLRMEAENFKQLGKDLADFDLKSNNKAKPIVVPEPPIHTNHWYRGSAAICGTGCPLARAVAFCSSNISHKGLTTDPTMESP